MEQTYPRLEMMAGPDEGLIISLKEGEQALGRMNGIEIYLSDTSVSRRHVSIKRSAQVLTIRDLGSRNGTIINGRKINPGTDYPLEHLSYVQVGIYEFRVTLRPVEVQDIKKENAPAQPKSIAEEPSSITHSDKLEEGASEAAKESVDPKNDQVNEEVLVPEDSPNEVPSTELQVQSNPASAEVALIPVEEFKEHKSKTLWVLLAFMAVLVLGIFLLRTPLKEVLVNLGLIDNPNGEVLEVVDTKEEEVSKTPPEALGIPPIGAEIQKPVFQETKPVPPESIQNENLKTNSFQVFLDLKSEPLPARIYYGENVLGVTPLKTPMQLTPGQDYEILAEFDLRDIHDRYQMKYTFKADTSDVLSHVFEAPIGVIKIIKLPRNADFHLEGYYSYDKFKSNPVRLTDLVYGKPVYVPFGHYVIELREKVKVGDSQTYVNEIRYHREFDLDDKRTLVELSINDKDLQFFPARIASVPSGAVLFLDEKEMGKTPFEGDLPLGQHALKLTRDGFFDYKTTLDMRTNTPYESTIKLETSKVGQYINRAKELRRIGQSQQAVGELVEGLKLGASQKEKSEIHWLLGDLYIDIKDYAQAKTYFSQARLSEDYKYQGTLGLAKVAFYKGETSECLKLLVEALINLPENDPLSREARSLFSQISPFKSVVYISTEPAGATVYVNNQMATQTSPLILSDLGLGPYRIEIQKNGFKTQQVKKSLKINEFVPIIIKLEPDQL